MLLYEVSKIGNNFFVDFYFSFNHITLENKFKMLKLHCFSYFLQFPDFPKCSALMYSDGRFSSTDDDGLEPKYLVEYREKKRRENKTYVRMMSSTCPITPLWSRSGSFAASQIASSKHFLPVTPLLKKKIE